MRDLIKLTLLYLILLQVSCWEILDCSTVVKNPLIKSCEKKISVCGFSSQFNVQQIHLNCSSAEAACNQPQIKYVLNKPCPDLSNVIYGICPPELDDEIFIEGAQKEDQEIEVCGYSEEGCTDESCFYPFDHPLTACTFGMKYYTFSQCPSN